MNFENRPTHSLRPYPGNARTHSPKQIKQISRSIERFGFNNPVLVDDDDQIIAGHGRVEAAKLLNLKTVPTVRLSHKKGRRTSSRRLPRDFDYRAEWA
jgi:ParB-like chromosome segregation protein Spo0J